MNNEDNKDNKDRIMNKNAQLWVDALRSGLYKQGRRWLHKEELDGSKFCCLGVACEIYQKEIGDLDIVELSDFVTAYDGYTYTLPSKVQDWLGLTSGDGRFNFPSTLTSMNDAGYSFEEIADVIESCPVGLFVKEKVI